MGNRISMPEHFGESIESLKMSNSLTSFFIEVLALSGSMFAENNREKEMVIWLAQQDQSVVGIGTVGFDIDDMPWTIESFERERNFILHTISGAMERHGWERLNYEPREDWIIECLLKFQRMIFVFDKDSIKMESYLEWSKIEEDDNNPTIPIGYPKCEIHDIYLSCHGCILCNNT